MAYLTDTDLGRDAIIQNLTKEDGGYNYIKSLQETHPEKYAIEWANHCRKIERLVDTAYIIKECYPANYRELLAVTSAEKWGRLINPEPILLAEANSLKAFCK